MYLQRNLKQIGGGRVQVFTFNCHGGSMSSKLLFLGLYCLVIWLNGMQVFQNTCDRPSANPSFCTHARGWKPALKTEQGALDPWLLWHPLCRAPSPASCQGWLWRQGWPFLSAGCVCLMFPLAGTLKCFCFSISGAYPRLQKMLDECQDRRSCQFLVNSRLFGTDPCPGTGKYLLVWYKCRPSKYFSIKSLCSVETKAFSYLLLTKEPF